MLQRIQTIFLLLTIPTSGALFLNEMYLAEVIGDLSMLSQQTQSALDDGYLHASDHILLLILGLLPGLVALIAIFQFRRRSRQMGLTRFSMIGYLLFMILSSILFYNDYTKLTGGDYYFEIGYGVLLPVLGIILCLLALRYIKKDEKLVRSMDRLR